MAEAQQELARNPANHVPLTPVDFLRRAADVYPGKVAVIHGERRYTYREFAQRCRRLASVLAARGIGRGDTVAVMAANVPALLECHYAVPSRGAVLNALNYRLDATTIAFCLEHGEAKVLLTDREFSATVSEALKRVKRRDLRGRHRRRASAPAATVWVRSSTRRGSPGEIRIFRSPIPATNGIRWRSSTRRARRAIPREWSTTTVART